MGMPRAALATLLALSVVLAGSLQAQQRSGGFRGTGGVLTGPGFRGQRFSRGGFSAGRCCFQHFRNSGSFILPFWYDQPFEYDQLPPEAAANQPAPPVIVVAAPSQPEVRERPPAEAKVIDIPGVQSPAKPRSPAIFILANGERLEAQRYMLTADSLRVTVDRQRRSIPLAMVDLKATLAANHERGIELRVPADRTEIFLEF